VVDYYVLGVMESSYFELNVVKFLCVGSNDWDRPMLRGDGTEIKIDGVMKQRNERAESNMACFLSRSNVRNWSNNDQRTNLTQKATLQADCVEKCAFQTSYMQSRCPYISPHTVEIASQELVRMAQERILRSLLVSESLKSASISLAVERTYHVQVVSH